MLFAIELYVTDSGKCPVREILDVLKETNPDDHAIIMAGIAKLKNSVYHRPPLSKPIGNEFFELRHVGKLNTRVLYFFAKGKRIIAVHGIRNKAKSISKQVFKAALTRKNDWLLRMNS